jgi:hypothetical protein
MHRLSTIALLAGALAQAEAASAQERFADPFAYCAAVGTIDAPDGRYDGPRMPDAVARGLKEAVGMAPDAPNGLLAESSVWRCMDGKVYACTVGANLPCSEKADTSRQPSQAVVDFCRQNAGVDVIPMVVTGRATVFEWRCEGSTPAIVRQFAHPDAEGYLSGIWYEIGPSGAE